MAPAATADNGPLLPSLPDEVSKPPAGVVLPPKDIRGQSCLTVQVEC
jgi:hypothetical protein